MKKQIEDFMHEQTFLVIKFRRELSKETDRGCSLMAASLLDHELEKLLRDKLVGSKKHLDSLFVFNGPLGTFSSRIRLSYSLGLIPKEIMNDLEVIRKVRNEFGHKYDPISFNTKEIKNRLNNLKNHYYFKGEDDPRGKFTNTVMGVLASIHSALIKFKDFDECEYIAFSDKFKKEVRKKTDRSVDEIMDLKEEDK